MYKNVVKLILSSNNQNLYHKINENFKKYQQKVDKIM